YARRSGSCDCARYGLAARVRRTRAVEGNCLSRTCSDLDTGWADAAFATRESPRRSPWLMRCLRASGLACLKERLAPAGDFLEISKIGRCQGLRRRLRWLRIGTAARINAVAPRWRPPPLS